MYDKYLAVIQHKYYFLIYEYICAYLSQVYPQFAETFVQENFQRALISSQSTSTWTISPPARQQLVETFQGALSNPEEGITLDISWSINRYFNILAPSPYSCHKRWPSSCFVM